MAKNPPLEPQRVISAPLLMHAVFARASPSVLIITIGLLVGVSFTLSKVVAMSTVPPTLALFWQLAIASAALSGLLMAKRRVPPIQPRYVIYYLGAGLLGISLPALVGYAVLEHITTGFYAALVTLSPMVTFVVTALVERRMLPMHRLFGIVIGFIGISLATLGGLEAFDVAPMWILFALAGPVVLALGNVFRSHAYPPNANPTVLAAGTLFLQLILVGSGMLLTGQLGESAAIDLWDFATLGGIGLITALSYVLTFEVQRRTDGVGFSQVGYFATLSGIAFGAIVFGETVPVAFAISLLFLFLGLAITNGHLTMPGALRNYFGSRGTQPLRFDR